MKIRDEIKDKKELISEIIYSDKYKDNMDIKVVCVGDEYKSPYIEDLADVPIGVIPFLLKEESIIFIEKVDD